MSRFTGQVYLLMLFLLMALPLFAQTNILYLEAQAVGSYDLNQEQFHPYSHHEHDAMQKPSLGFDYLKRFGSSSRDFGYLSLQARLAYDEYYASKLKVQIYNAFLNLKTREFDVWLGHNKPSIGIATEIDNHAALLPDNTMSALNYDRDWGVGVKLDRGTPSFSAAFTSGSGMPLKLKDTYLLSSRISWGDIERDNHSLGMSAAYGQVLRSMGYVNMHNYAKHNLLVGGLDFSAKAYRFEVHGDLIAGEYHDKDAYSGFLRLGYFFLPEERGNIELQAMAQELTGVNTLTYSVATSLRLSSDLTFRTSYNFQNQTELQTISAQLYYLKGLPF